MSEAICRTHFDNELKWIVNPDLRDQVIQVFDQLCPDYFWERAASKSGRFHPEFARKTGGLILHTKAVARMGREIARAEYPAPGDDAQPFYNDCFVAAALLHDMMKDGDPSRPKLGKAWADHGIHVTDAVFGTFFGGDAARLTPEWMHILWMVASHMGIWTYTEKYKPHNVPDENVRRACILFHLADYVVSRPLDTWIREIDAHTVGEPAAQAAA